MYGDSHLEIHLHIRTSSENFLQVTAIYRQFPTASPRGESRRFSYHPELETTNSMQRTTRSFSVFFPSFSTSYVAPFPALPAARNRRPRNCAINPISRDIAQRSAQTTKKCFFQTAGSASVSFSHIHVPTFSTNVPARKLAGGSWKDRVSLIARRCKSEKYSRMTVEKKRNPRSCGIFIPECLAKLVAIRTEMHAGPSMWRAGEL